MSMLKGGKQMIIGGGTEVLHSNIVFNTAHQFTAAFPRHSNGKHQRMKPISCVVIVLRMSGKHLSQKRHHIIFFHLFPNFHSCFFGRAEKEEKKAKLCHSYFHMGFPH